MSSLSASGAGEVLSGLPVVGSVEWGSHLCHFYRSRADLAEPLVSYFRQGLANNEQCLWVACQPLDAELARQALRAEVPDLASYEERGQIEIIDYRDWYQRTGDMDGAGVLQMWIERERAALASGFSGLRLTGNTFWLEREDWDDFAAYEAAVHEAFRGRNILALCSYSLERCTIDDVLDVLGNHEFALLRREGRWELIRSATHLLAAVGAPDSPPPPEHLVHFYSGDRYPADVIADFLADGVAAGHAGIAIATGPHREAIAAELGARGSASAVTLLDAEAILASCTADGRLHLDELRNRYRDELRALAPRGQKLYIYGEVVDLLCQRGEPEAAVALEEVWNELMRALPIALLCTYDLASFQSAAEAQVYLSVCATHSEVTVDAAPRDHDAIANALAAEIQKRRAFEVERLRRARDDEDARRRLELLQRVTSALSTVSRLDELEQVFPRDICGPLGAMCGLIAIPAPDGATLRTICQHGDDRTGGPAADVHRSGQPLWRSTFVPGSGAADTAPLAVVPLRLLERTIGVIALGFIGTRRFDVQMRALVTDIAHQVTLTINRILMFEEISQQRNQMACANQAKDQFLAMLGHELRNPLAAIRSAAALLEASGGNSSTRRAQQVLQRQSAHMAKLIDGLLDVSRIVSGKITVSPRPVDLVAVIRAVLRDRFDDASPDIRTELARPPLWILADEIRLAQILDNLLSNAVKFSGPGGTVTVTAHADGDNAVIAVRDDGVGIESALLPHIFEPFRQADQELSRSTGGLGLGLSVVKGLVELHHGRVTAHSDGPGRGAELRVTLPLHRSGCDQQAEERRGSQPATARILVVEDNHDAADMLRMLLELSGHEVKVAHDGPAALELASRLEPDIVLCDIGLPGAMTGYDVARALRGKTRLAGVTLVALTGYGRSEDVECARAAGFDHHLTKPVDLDSLETVIDDARNPGVVPTITRG